jgi:hypothetical protein
MDALREYAVDAVEIVRRRHVSRCFIFFVQLERLLQPAPNIAFKHRVFDEVYKVEFEKLSAGEPEEFFMPLERDEIVIRDIRMGLY